MLELKSLSTDDFKKMYKQKLKELEKAYKSQVRNWDYLFREFFLFFIFLCFRFLAKRVEGIKGTRFVEEKGGESVRFPWQHLPTNLDLLCLLQEASVVDLSKKKKKGGGGKVSDHMTVT